MAGSDPDIQGSVEILESGSSLVAAHYLPTTTPCMDTAVEANNGLQASVMQVYSWMTRTRPNQGHGGGV